MNINEAKDIIKLSVENLIRRKGQILGEQLEAEIINSACLYILKKYSQNIKQVAQTDLIMNYLQDNLSFQPIAKCFTQAALQLFPNNYNSDLAEYANITIIQNITWSGMYDFLKKYYNDNHGREIDDNATNKIIFISSRHTRHENGIISSSIIHRRIELTFSNEGKKLFIEIIPTISPKTAYLVYDTTNKRKYKGDDPDFEFILNINSKLEIEEITMYRLDKKVFWEYKL